MSMLNVSGAKNCNSAARSGFALAAKFIFVFTASVILLPSRAFAAEPDLAVTAIPKVLLRSPEPLKLAEFYKAIGFSETSRTPVSVNFYLSGDVGAFEVMKMDPAVKPAGPKTSRTQQDVVAIFEVTDQDLLVARAKAAGATLIERWDAPDRPATIYYVGDPENNILGFAARHHHPRIKTP